MGVIHLRIFNFDYSPLWVRSRVDLVNLSKLKPFKFLSAWLEHDGFANIVYHNWSSLDS